MLKKRCFCPVYGLKKGIFPIIVAVVGWVEMISRVERVEFSDRINRIYRIEKWNVSNECGINGRKERERVESVWRLRHDHENRRIDESPDGDLALLCPHPASASPGGAYTPSPTLRVTSLRRTRMPACAGHE